MSPVASARAHGTGADPAKNNVNRGAIAIGHPLGAGGAPIMTTLLNALEQRGGRFGFRVMCERGGLAHHRAVGLKTTTEPPRFVA